LELSILRNEIKKLKTHALISDTKKQKNLVVKDNSELKTPSRMILRYKKNLENQDSVMNKSILIESSSILNLKIVADNLIDFFLLYVKRSSLDESIFIENSEFDYDFSQHLYSFSEIMDSEYQNKEFCTLLLKYFISRFKCHKKAKDFLILVIFSVRSHLDNMTESFDRSCNFGLLFILSELFGIYDEECNESNEVSTEKLTSFQTSKFKRRSLLFSSANEQTIYCIANLNVRHKLFSSLFINVFKALQVICIISRFFKTIYHSIA
jgi:hypothetical protein